MAKTIFVLLDGARLDTVSECAGYLEHAAETASCAKYAVRAELPSLSRPLYETCLTGLTVDVHGIVSNSTVRRSNAENAFSLCKKNGLITAAASYHWISELYNSAPFDTETQRFQLENAQGTITHGIFYSCDEYPDSHLFADGEFLRTRYTPDFMLYHSMGIDNAGHTSPGGGESSAYHDAVSNAADLLARLLPVWLADEWNVVISADHGMNARGSHGGITDCERDVPLYIFSPRIKTGNFCGSKISQLNIAPLLCFLLEIPPAPAMIQGAEIIKN